MKSKALVFSAKEEAVIQDLDVPDPVEGEIQIRTAYSGISAGTEGWVFRDLFKRAPIRFPCVPGYQRSGIVTAVGSNVGDWKVGDRALALFGTWSDSKLQPVLGAHVALANAPINFAYRLDGEVQDIDASFAVVAQVGYNAANRPSYTTGDWIVVLGDGLIGQFAAQAAKARGARVILVGHRHDRLELALKYSANATINSETDDVTKSVKALVGADSVPVVIDAVQTLASQNEYLNLLERGRGQIVYTGFSPNDHWADMGLLQEHELTTHFVNAFTRERMQATLGLMASGKMRVRPLITHLVSFRRAPEMFQMILNKKESFLGIVLDWDDSH
jgi:3-hydroxyethyl bacteriochlorophyllide a dehydrogenase